MIESRLAEIRNRKVQEDTSEKRTAFCRLRREGPDVAEFLRNVASVFGKPDAIEIRGNGWDFVSGKFRTAQEYEDFEIRCERQEQSG